MHALANGAAVLNSILSTLLLLGAAPGLVTAMQDSARQEMPVFDSSAMDRLAFLEGRWSGTAPDGTIFYEAYDRPDATTWRSRRFKDAGFSETSDGSTVTFRNGVVTSSWGAYSWRASAIEADHAAFEPINAPSAFTWRKIDADTLEVVQEWKDDKGVPQRYALQLKRMR